MKSLLLRLVVCSVIASSALAQFRFQESGRTGSFEVGATIQWLSGETVDGRLGGRDGDLELEDLFGGGMNFGYHINEYLNLNTDLFFSNADINFVSPGVGSLHDDAEFVAWTVNLDYYVF